MKRKNLIEVLEKFTDRRRMYADKDHEYVIVEAFDDLIKELKSFVPEKTDET